MTTRASGPPGRQTSRLGHSIPASFSRTVYVVAAGAGLRCDAGGWSDGVAIVRRGQIDLETTGGVRLRLGEDDMFTLARLGPVHIFSVEPGPAVITVVGRRASDDQEPAAEPPSQR